MGFLSALKSKAPTHAEVLTLWNERRRLERRAGIPEQGKHPYGRSDKARLEVRERYFAVPDVALRKKLIRAERACSRAWPATMHALLEEARRKLAKAQRRANAPLPWLQAGLWAAACVAIGASFFQLYGAIAGALVGFFLGQGVIAGARTSRPEAVRIAQENVDSRQESEEIGWGPEYFSESEEETGQPDKPES